MISRFLESFFSKDGPAPEAIPDPARVRVATCVLLLEVARADDELSPEERNRIVSILRDRFSLSEEDAQELVAASKETREESYDLWKFTHQINEAYAPAEKVRIIEEVWRVIYADGALGAHEDYIVHKLAKLLNLDHNQLIAAKMKVREEMRPSD